MRLLPVRPDHAGRRTAGEEQEAEPAADRRAHGRQHLPLRHLSAHRARHSTRRPGGLINMNMNIKQTVKQTEVSRRSIIKGAGGLTFAFALTGTTLGRISEAFAADGAKLNAY